MALSPKEQATPVRNFPRLEGARELSEDLISMSGIGLLPFLPTPSPGEWFGSAREHVESSMDSKSPDSKAHFDQKLIRNTPHLNPLALNPVGRLPQDLLTTASDLEEIELTFMSNLSEDTFVDTDLTTIDLLKTFSFNMNQHLKRQLSFAKIRNSRRRRAPLVPFPRPSHPLMYSESSVSTDDMPVFYKHTCAGVKLGKYVVAKGIQLTVKIPASLFPEVAHCQDCRRWYQKNETFESCGQFCNACSKGKLEAFYNPAKEMGSHVPLDICCAKKNSGEAAKKEMGWFRKLVSRAFGDKQKSEKLKKEQKVVVHFKRQEWQARPL